MSRGAWLYLAMVAAAGGVAAAWHAGTVDLATLWDVVTLELFTMAVLAKQWPITYAPKRKLDASLGIYFLAALYRPDDAVATAVAAEVVGHAILILRRQRRLPALLFNSGQHALGTSLAVWVLSLGVGPVSVVAAAAAMYLSSHVLVSGMVALTSVRRLHTAVSEATPVVPTTPVQVSRLAALWAARWAWCDGFGTATAQGAGVLAVSALTHYVLHHPALLPLLMTFPTAALWMVWRRQLAEAERRAAEARLEAEQEKVRVRQEFLSVAAHELRTPITTIKGYTFALKRQGQLGFVDRERSLRQLDTMDQQCIHLVQLIDQLLDLSRLEANKLKIAPAQADLAALCERVADAMQLATGRVITVDASRRPVLALDAVRIEQVLVNLVNNAVKFSPADLPVYVHLRERGGRAVIQVEDFGNGVPEAAAGLIFERYQQAHGSEAVGGLGLGLFISKEIVQLHGGTISVRNAPHGGAVFTVELPGVPTLQAMPVVAAHTPELAPLATSLSLPNTAALA